MKTHFIAAGVVAALAFSGIGAAWSQDMQPVQFVQAPQGITALGHSELKEKPDVARVTLTVTTNNKNSAEAVRQNAERTTAVLSALPGIGIAGKDIETLSYTVQPQYDYNRSPAALTGYQVQNTIQVTIHDLTKVGLVIDTITKGGTSEIGGVTFDLLDQGQAQAQALAQAVASAKLKAGAMASAAGVDLGRLLTITEGAATFPIRPVPVFAMKAMAAPAAPETPIADQQITITADATLVYAMGEAK